MSLATLLRSMSGPSTKRKGRKKSKAQRAHLSMMQKYLHTDPQVVRRKRRIALALYADPAYRERNARRVRKSHRTPEYRAKMRRIQLEILKREAIRMQIAQSNPQPD